MYYVSILRRLSPSGSIRVYQVLCSFLRVYKAPRNSKEIPPLKLFSGVGHSLRRLVRFMERDDCNRQFFSLFLLVQVLLGYFGILADPMGFSLTPRTDPCWD